MGRRLIKQLRDGDIVDAVFCVADPARRGAAKGPALLLTVQDAGGQMKLKKWSLSEDEWARIREAEFVHVFGCVASYNEALEITAERVQPAMAPEDIGELIPATKGDRQDHWRRFRDHANSIRDPFLSKLLKHIFRERAFRDLFRETPAAKTHHHAYVGGLLEHTLQVADLCVAVCERVPELREARDLVLTGALLHDIGKVQELERSGGRFNYSVSGNLLGHVVMGAAMVEKAMDAVDGFPPRMRAALLHLILSHQGKKEWGAPVEPSTPAAFVLSNCDYISASVNECFNASVEGASSEFAWSRALNRYIHTGAVEMTTHDQPITPAIEDDIRPPLRLIDGGLADAHAAGLVLLPIVGRIAAGAPIDVEPEIEGYRAVAAAGADARTDVILAVRGDSMRDAHILNGDLVHIRKQSTARHGDIVAARVNDGFTVKRYEEENGAMVLRAQSAGHPDIRPGDGDEAVIIGKVVGLIRDYVE